MGGLVEIGMTPHPRARKPRKLASMKPRAEVRLNVYAVIDDAVEIGIAHGLRRAYKHTDAPTDDQIIETIRRAVMETLDEVIVWETP